MKKRRVSRQEFIENQRSYCIENELPFFMPHDGYCPGCGRDIIAHLIKYGMRGNEELITGCPYCYRSYVD